jgi:peptide/nickel transport system ATP-binding protein
MNDPGNQQFLAPPLLEAAGLTMQYAVSKAGFGKPQVLRAVDGVSFTLTRGETLSIVGESGCGKSSVARLIMRLEELTAGRILIHGRRIDHLSAHVLRPMRRQVQIVFQDPFSSLDPRMKVRDILAEPVRNFRLASGASAIRQRVADLLAQVRLPASASERFPHEFSGGQRQRIGIARALAAEPEAIVCDEAVSALDLSVKAQIVNLLQDLQRDLGLALLFISHDLAIVEHITHRVAVMYLGQIVEMADRHTIFGGPRHPYTAALLSAVPIPDPSVKRERILLKGDVPSPINPPSGCRFHTRCPFAFQRCRTEIPALRQLREGHVAACHLNDLPGHPLARAAEILGGAGRPIEVHA